MHLLALMPMIFLYAEHGGSSSGGSSSSSSSSASNTTPRDEDAVHDEAAGGEVSGLLKALIQKVDLQAVALDDAMAAFCL